MAMLLAVRAATATAQTLTIVASFTGSAGRGPWCQLAQGANGNLYGTTYSGGARDDGTVFEVTPSGELTTLADFHGTNGANPYAGLLEGADGNFYGTTASGGRYNAGTVFSLSPGGGLTTLASFDGTNGAGPTAKLLLGTDGNFYGTADTVFQMTPAGLLTTLHRFSHPSTSGDGPWGGLVDGPGGALYGATEEGGDISLNLGNGYGTIYRLGLDGALKTLMAFQGTNGSFPESALVLATDGDFYGTTVAGGEFGHGTVFKMTPDGALTTLVSFDQTNGAVPYAGLIQASDGNFYGTTAFGGDLSLFNGRGLGTVFRVTADGILTTLARFEETNGSAPTRALLQARDGDLYGAAAGGGPPGAGGVIFKISGLNLVPKFRSIRVSSGLVHLVWEAIPGRSYRVQYRTDLAGTNWTDLPGDVVANSSTAVKTDAVAARQRFYRVLLLP